MHVDEARSEIQELESLRAQTSAWRGGLTLAFVVVTIASVLVMWNSLNNLTKDGPQKQQFIGTLSSDLQSGALPAVEQIGSDALHRIDFGEQINKLNKRTPEVADATVSQFKALATDLPKQSEQRLDEQFDSILKDRQARLKQAFPNATDEQIATLMMNVTSEAHVQVAGIADDLFSPHIQSLNSIVSDLNTIEAKEGQ